jgi:ribosomal protein S18 acetylase RimI-like enzyme
MQNNNVSNEYACIATEEIYAQTMPKVRIRPAVFPADRQMTSELFLAYAKSLPIKLDFQGFEEELAGLPGKYAVEKGGAVYLAYTTTSPLDTTGPSSEQLPPQETIMGIVALRSFPTTNSTSTCELKRLYLTPSSRGLGASKQLMNAVLARARSLGYKEMLLDTLHSISAAQHLYQSYGFTEIESYYQSVNNAVFYKLTL